MKTCKIERDAGLKYTECRQKTAVRGKIRKHKAWREGEGYVNFRPKKAAPRVTQFMNELLQTYNVVWGVLPFFWLRYHGQ